MRIKQGLVVGSVVLLLLSGFSPSAGAHTQEEAGGGNCSDGGISYRFSGAGWSGVTNGGLTWDIRPILEGHIEQWEDETQMGSSDPVVNMSRVVSGGEVAIYFVPGNEIGNDVARAHCGNGYVKVNEERRPPTGGPDIEWIRDMGALLAHELGHIMGHRHTHRDESDDGVRPLMNSCLFFVDLDVLSLSQDDRLGHQRLNGPQGPETMSANPGMDSGTQFFRTTGGSMFGAVDETLWFRRSTPGNSAHKFYQRHSIAASAGNWYDVVAEWSRTASGAAGMVWASMYARPVTYSGGSSCGDPVTGHSINGSRSPGLTWYFKGDDSDAVSGSASSSGSLQTTVATMTGNTVEIELRVSHSVASATGASQFLSFDNVRLRQRFGSN